MILDFLNQFCSATSVAAVAGTALVGDVIDLLQASRDIGTGQNIRLRVVTTTEIITGGTAGTIRHARYAGRHAARCASAAPVGRCQHTGAGASGPRRAQGVHAG